MDTMSLLVPEDNLLPILLQQDASGPVAHGYYSNPGETPISAGRAMEGEQRGLSGGQGEV